MKRGRRKKLSEFSEVALSFKKAWISSRNLAWSSPSPMPLPSTFEMPSLASLLSPLIPMTKTSMVLWLALPLLMNPLLMMTRLLLLLSPDDDGPTIIHGTDTDVDAVDSGVFGLDFMDAAGFWQDALTDPLPTPLAYLHLHLFQLPGRPCLMALSCLAVLLACAPLGWTRQSSRPPHLHACAHTCRLVAFNQ